MMIEMMKRKIDSENRMKLVIGRLIRVESRREDDSDVGGMIKMWEGMIEETRRMIEKKKYRYGRG